MAQKELQAQQAQEQEPVYYLEAANGLTVRVPESRLEAWQAEQDRQRSGKSSLNATQRRLVESIVSDLYGSQR